jgi:peroxiredoxin
MTHEAIPVELADCVVQDEAGADVRLGDVWKDRPTILAFVRHFGCVFCREQVTELNREKAKIDQQGGQLVVVGSGTPNFVRGFREQTGFEGTVLCDPSVQSYKQAGMKRGFFTVINPLTAARGLASMARGFRQGRVQGDAFQEGGVLVVRPPDQLVYKQVSSSAGDHPPAAEVIGALSAS